ncbi:hypothetical protein [Tsukamurella hominis]|uniref:hypothetical protein n=1 Tax=Tsukamurella hominis TaxID=1970232 RepID=UPI0039EB0C2B
MDEYHDLGPAIGALRDGMGKSQPQIHRAGGPSVSEQSRVEQGGRGGLLSPSMVEKYATAFGNLGATRIASALLPISRVLLDEAPPEQLIELTPTAIVINTAMGKFSSQRIEVTELRLADDEPALTGDHVRTWDLLVEQLLEGADQVFAEQSGAPAPITRAHVSPPRARFRSSGYNRDQDVIAIDPLEDLPGKPLPRVQQMLATLTEGKPSRSSWAALMLYAIARRTPIGSQRPWTEGPLAALFAAKDIAVELSKDGAFGMGVAGDVALFAAQHELQDLLRPFLDSILDAVGEVDSEGRLVLGESAVTTISELKTVESVAFGPDVAAAAALLAALATGKDRTVLTVRPKSVAVARSYYTPDPPSRLELALVPGLESIAVAQWRGETVAMRLRY